MPGGVQGSGRGADGNGFAGTDLTGDHPQGVLVDAPGDAGYRLGVSAVAVQHRGGQCATEGHGRETPMRLQTLELSSADLLAVLVVGALGERGLLGTGFGMVLRRGSRARR